VTTPEKSLTTLEYDKVIARLAGMTQTARGKALALALQPSSEYGEVLHRQRLTAEGRTATEGAGSLAHTVGARSRAYSRNVPIHRRYRCGKSLAKDLYLARMSRS